MYFEYMWVFFTLAYLSLVYPAIAIKYYLVQKKMAQFVRDKNKLIVKLAGYPFIFFIAWAPMATCRILFLLGIKVSSVFLFATVLWHALTGFFNAIWFSYSRNIALQLKEKISRSSKGSKSGSHDKGKEALNIADPSGESEI